MDIPTAEDLDRMEGSAGFIATLIAEVLSAMDPPPNIEDVVGALAIVIASLIYQAGEVLYDDGTPVSDLDRIKIFTIDVANRIDGLRAMDATNAAKGN